MPLSNGSSRKEEDLISRRGNWLARASKYSDGSRVADQKCEDLVARRIVAGLGYTEKGLARLERGLDIPYDGSKTLLERATTVVDVLSGGMFSTDPDTRRYLLQVRPTDRRHCVVFDNLGQLSELASMEKDGLILMGRVGNDKLAWAYVVIPDGTMPPWLIQPPLCLLAKNSGYSFWYREVTDIIYDMAKYLRWPVSDV